ncbi:MAG: sigma 54-interacting transcriptional regulator [Chitinispirillaceae bacterium]
MTETDLRASLNFNGLSVLYSIAKVLSTGGPLNNIMYRVLQILEHQAGMKRGMISILSTQSEKLVVDIAHGISESEKQKGIYRLGEGITGQVAKTGNPVMVPKIEEEKGFLDRTGARKSVPLDELAFLCVPIRIGSTVLGVLSVDRVSVEQEVTLEGELSFLQAVSDLIAKTVQLRRKEQKQLADLRRENHELKLILENKGRPEDMIGNSGSMREVYRLIAQVAPSITTVLIRGETGTGKELVARAIHQKSPFREGPFIAVNCAALPESLLESELYGHEKGAFTGAHMTRTGKFEAAHNGTLFLDEIGELSLSAQSRLLRVIQEREFHRVGGMEAIKVKVRLITATNRNLEKDVKEKRFREDLFYRLNVFTVLLPPLRERGADVLLLADHFIKKYSRLHRKTVERVSTTAIEMLSSYGWPGNVRELENVIERAVLVSEGKVVEGHDLPPSVQQANTEFSKPLSGNFESRVSAYEKELIIDALKDTGGNQTEAAKLLGTTKRIIQYKIEKLKIDYRRFRSKKNNHQSET